MGRAEPTRPGVGRGCDSAWLTVQQQRLTQPCRVNRMSTASNILRWRTSPLGMQIEAGGNTEAHRTLFLIANSRNYCVFIYRIFLLLKDKGTSALHAIDHQMSKSMDLSWLGPTWYLYCRLVPKEHCLQSPPSLTTVLIPLSMILRNVKPGAVALHFNLEHFGRGRQRHSESHSWGWPSGLLFTIIKRKSLLYTSGQKPWPAGQIWEAAQFCK